MASQDVDLGLVGNSQYGVSVGELHDLTADAPRGAHDLALAQCFQHVFRLALAFLLRPNDQEVEDEKHHGQKPDVHASGSAHSHGPFRPGSTTTATGGRAATTCGQVGLQPRQKFKNGQEHGFHLEKDGLVSRNTPQKRTKAAETYSKAPSTSTEWHHPISVLSRYQKAVQEKGLPADPEALELARALGAHAPALFGLIVADPEILTDVQRRSLDRAEDDRTMEVVFAAIGDLEDGPGLYESLRRQRHRAMVRIALREVLRFADIDQTAAELATLASVAIDAALRACRASVERKFGSTSVPISVLGMGKLGGGELNFGSDVDLIFFYESDDAEVEGGATSVHELFSRVVRRTTRALSEVTEHGFVFRVDLRLRPEGSRGPVVNSLASAERYYASFGRDWERAALLRARPVAGDPTFGRTLIRALQPFVYRRAVQPEIAHSMHSLMQKARRDLGVEDRNIKLGRGGIREAEFFVQTLQLIWGGVHPELRVAGTMEGLDGLKAQGLVSHAESQALRSAWTLLRRVEHRIHMSRGYQTHDLPDTLGELAVSLGFDDEVEFTKTLSEARDRVAALFDSLIDANPDDAAEARNQPLLEALRDDADAEHVASLLPAGIWDAHEAAAHLKRLARFPPSPFGALGRIHRPGLAGLLLDEAAAAADIDSAIRYMAEFFLKGGFGWDKVLEQEPRLARRLMGLFGASPTLAQTLVGHPETLGEVVLGPSAPSIDTLRDAHEAIEAIGDVENFVGAMRTVKRERTLEVGMAYVDRELDLRAATKHLTALADMQIRSAFDFAFRESVRSLGRPSSGMAVVGLGKLGGEELGFGSDLDLLFLYERDGETSKGKAYQEVFSRTAQRLLRLLSQPDAGGPGFETDARLRPGGSQGVLVTSVEAFRRYQKDRAECWEQQALIRARVVVSHGFDVRDCLERAAFGAPPRNPERLDMLRRRMQLELAQEKAHRYHPKLGYGALVDVELLTQWLQMRHGSKPEVRRRHTLEALEALGSTGSIAPHVQDGLSDAYIFFRQVEQAIALLDRRSGALSFGGPRALAVARAIGLSDRDGESPDQVLQAAWRRRATEVRALFDEHVHPVDAPSPWDKA